MVGSYPPLRPAGRIVVPAPTGAEATALDRAAIDTIGVPQSVLMENAGRSAALVIERLFGAARFVVLAGGGNNGGDAVVVARSLMAWGHDTTLVLVADRDDDEPLLHGWPGRTRRDLELGEEGWASLLTRAVVIDGILGTGVSGPPRDRQADAIRRVNGAGCPVVSLDVPSGADADGGAVPGEAIRATVTVAFGAPKLGCFLHPARAHVGRLVAVEIGFPPGGEAGVGAHLVTPAWALDRLPRRKSDTHKNAEGRVLVVAGSEGMAGAAILAARSAFAAGAGVVRICSAPANREILQTAVPEAMVVDSLADGSLEAATRESDALVVGPGLGAGDAAAALARRALVGGDCPLLLDADGLNLAASGAIDLREAAAHRPVLVTPHVGEMARLLGRSNDEVTADRASTLRDAVASLGATVLFKGAPSLVGAAGEPILVDTQATSDLAVAGMGDTLAGVCGALMARGCPPRDAGALGLFVSGRAARLAGRGASLTPTDVARWLPDALLESAVPPSDLGFPFVLFDAEAPR